MRPPSKKIRSSDTTLRTVVLLEKVIEGVPGRSGITASSVDDGATPPFQFAPVFQSPPAGLIHVTVAGTTRASSSSNCRRRWKRRSTATQRGDKRARRLGTKSRRSASATRRMSRKDMRHQQAEGKPTGSGIRRCRGEERRHADETTNISVCGWTVERPSGDTVWECDDGGTKPWAGSRWVSAAGTHGGNPARQPRYDF